MHGQRLRYGAAVAALVLASCFLYLVPLVSSVVLDVIISDNGSGTSPFISRTVESIGGRDFARANLWIAPTRVRAAKPPGNDTCHDATADCDG